MATIDDVRRIAMSLPRTTEHLIGDNTKFRVGRLVYASVSADEERLGGGLPQRGEARRAGGHRPGQVHDAATRRRAVPVGPGPAAGARRDRTARTAHRRLVHG